MDLLYDPGLTFFVQNAHLQNAHALEMSAEFEEPINVKPPCKRIRDARSPIEAEIEEKRVRKPIIEAKSTGSDDGDHYYMNALSNLKFVGGDLDLNVQKEEEDAFFDREAGSESVIGQLIKGEEGDNEVSDGRNKLVNVESAKMNRGEAKSLDYSYGDSVTAQIIEQYRAINKKLPAKAIEHVPSVRKESKREKVTEGKKLQIQPSKQVAIFDWTEEIIEPSYNTESSDSDEEPEKFEIPKEIDSKKPSEYKDKLIEYISCPFDKKKYKGLIAKATYRAKKVLIKETRNGVRTVQTNELSKSYFDWYPDLASEVDKVGKRKGLILLRGFFFWLQNLGCEGAFRPWVKAVK